jgi:hypothetical protein
MAPEFNQNSPQPPEPQTPTPNPLSVMQPGERIIFELKRHPIGILTIYIATGLVLTVLGIMAFAIGPGLVSSANQGQVNTIVGGLFGFFTLLCLLFNFIATVVYWGNRWILTDDSITQISQASLFKKETSSLGLESLEDVTVEQYGILPHLFNYGTLKAETAGHRSKFVFNYAPNPNYYAQKILEAHEQENQEIRQYGRDEDNPPPPSQQPPNYPPAA